MGLSDVIKSAVQTAYTVIDDLKFEGELRRKIVTSIDPVTDIEIYTEQSYTFKGVEQDTTAEEINGQILSIDFYVMALFNENIEPQVTDNIIINGKSFEIKYVKSIKPAQDVFLWTIGVSK